MTVLKSLIYPECYATPAYTMAEIEGINANALEQSYPIIPVENRVLHTPENEWFVRGKSYRVLDAIANILAIPAKILLWNSRYHTNYVSPETEKILESYMRDNHLHHVKVYINKYDPLDVMKRSFTNPRITLISRIALAPIIALGALMPTRLIGSDMYNPLSDSIHLFSDDPTIALHEAGHAKDFTRFRFPLLYSYLNFLPFGTLYKETRASADAIEYLKAKRFTKLVPDAYKTLTPALASYIASAALEVLSFISRMPFSFAVKLTPGITRVVTWLSAPVIKPAIAILSQFPPFLSRIKTICMGLGHVVGRVAAVWYNNHQPKNMQAAVEV